MSQLKAMSSLEDLLAQSDSDEMNEFEDSVTCMPILAMHEMDEQVSACCNCSVTEHRL